MTKKYKFRMIITGILSFLCTVGPLIVFTIMGIAEGEGKEKLVLAMTSVGSIIISLIAVMKKIHLKSVTYILMIGLWIALDNLLPFIFTVAICTIVDELVLSPLHHRWKEDYYTNKQIDKRLEM